MSLSAASRVLHVQFNAIGPQLNGFEESCQRVLRCDSARAPVGEIQWAINVWSLHKVVLVTGYSLLA